MKSKKRKEEEEEEEEYVYVSAWQKSFEESGKIFKTVVSVVTRPETKSWIQKSEV